MSSPARAMASLDIVLPLGISFFTFTQIAFLVDAYRGEASEYNPSTTCCSSPTSRT